MAVTLAQLACRVGDLHGNCDRILTLAKGCDDAFLVTPELSICGYPPEDLLAYPSFVHACTQAAADLAQQLKAVYAGYVVIGLPRYLDGKLYNVVQVIHGGAIVVEYAKMHLPNYGVFDEQRYFTAGSEITSWEVDGKKYAVAICHDIWQPAFRTQVAQLELDFLLVSNASPFYLGVQAAREQHTTALATGPTTVAYVNMVGGQDEHVFDGGSHVACNGEVVRRCQPFVADVISTTQPALAVTAMPEIEQIATALQVGLRDYVARAGGGPVFVGLSGGIDSAVVACIAVQALGANKVTGVLMPSRYTAAISVTDAQELATNLGVTHEVIDIEPAFTALHESLQEALGSQPDPVALENLQSRIRGNMLMTLANGAGGLVITTGNKSELATGYATLYGDMAGAFDLLKDLTKQRVYELARFINAKQEIIPVRIIERPPTAELRENQFDSDSLPSYEKLDAIIEAIIERLEEPQEVAKTFGYDNLKLFMRLLVRSEFKRRQAPIGPTITNRAFGKDWRMPVSNSYILGNDGND